MPQSSRGIAGLQARVQLPKGYWRARLRLWHAWSWKQIEVEKRPTGRRDQKECPPAPLFKNSVHFRSRCRTGSGVTPTYACCDRRRREMYPPLHSPVPGRRARASSNPSAPSPSTMPAAGHSYWGRLSSILRKTETGRPIHGYQKPNTITAGALTMRRCSGHRCFLLCTPPSLQ